MIGKVKCKSYNGSNITLKLELNVSHVRLSDNSGQEVYRSKELFGEINDLMINKLNLFKNLWISCKIISPQLDTMLKQKLEVSYQSLAELVSLSIFSYLLEEDNMGSHTFEYPEYDGKFNQFYHEYFSKTNLKIMINKLIDQDNVTIENRQINDIKTLIRQRDYTTAEKRMSLLDYKILSPNDLFDYRQLNLLLSYKINHSQIVENKKKFLTEKQNYKYDKVKLAIIYMDYIKYLQDIREEKSPSALLKELSDFCQIDFLPADYQAYNYYLLGRYNYGRGFYLSALENFDKAYLIYKTINSREEEISDVLNSCVNCFNDNFYFEIAEDLAMKALGIREKYHLASSADTFGVLGGLYFKKRDFQNAIKYFEKSYEKLKLTLKPMLLNKTFNYLAKSYMMNQDYDKAQYYLNESFNIIAEATAKEKSFSYLYQLILALKMNNNEMFNSMKKVFQNPENFYSFDKVSLGWAYSFMAEHEYLNGYIKQGHDYLSDAISFFTEDRYFFEAAYIWNYHIIYNEDKVLSDSFIEPVDVLSNFLEYYEAHLNMDDYQIVKDNTDKKTSIKTLMQDFFELFKEASSISDKELQKKQVKKMLDLFCLF